MIAGTLIAGNDSAFGSGTVAMAPGTTLSFSNTGNFIIANPFTISGDPIFTPPGGTTQTLTGVISDGGTPGTLDMNGAGTLALTNTNTYTGATNINSGILALSGTGSIATSSQVALASPGTFDISQTTAGASIKTLADTAVGQAGTVSLGSQTLTVTAGSTTFSGTIQNDGIAGGTGGSLTIAGGTQTLAGANTYTGPTTINTAATLALSGGGSVSDSSVVTANGTFDVSQASFFDPIKTLAGSGNVQLGGNGLVITAGSTEFSDSIQDGGLGGGIEIFHGVQTLSGTNTYTNETQIDSGATLALKGSGSIADSNAVAFSGGTGKFDISQTTAGASISALFSISSTPKVLLGSQTLTITEASSFNGVIADGGLGGGVGGNLIIDGFGQALEGTSTYTGTTMINGTLEVDGSIATSSLTSINNGGTLFGVGTVGKTQVNGGGTFAPGSGAPGSFMNVSGNLAFASAAVYMVQVNPATASFALVTGTTALNGTVNANFAAGAYVPGAYDILHSTGLISGAFSGVTSTNLPAGLSASLTVTAHDVFLDLDPIVAITGPFNTNQQSVATALNNFFNATDGLPPNFITVFDLTGSALTTALSQLDGEVATDSKRVVFQSMTELLQLMLDPFADGRNGFGGGSTATPFAPEQEAGFPPDVALAYNSVLKSTPSHPSPASGGGSGWGNAFDQRWTAWGAAYGGASTANGDPVVGSTNVTANTYGFAAGMDRHVTPDTVVGFALAGGGTNWSLAQNLGSGRSDAFQGGIYGTTHAGPAYLAAALAFANHWMTTDRTAALGDQLTARFNAQSYGARLEAGYRYGAAIGVTPYAALQEQVFHAPGYSETDLTGGGFGLSYNATTATDTRSELGARFDDLTTLGAMPLVLRARVAWAHDWVDNPSLGATFQALPGASFIVNGPALSKDSALASAGAELHITPKLALLAKFDGEFASGSQTYAGTGTLRYTW